MKSKLLLILSCLTAVHAWAANATVADLYNAVNQRIGADTYTFFNFVPANPTSTTYNYGYRTKSWATLGDVCDSSWSWSNPDHQPITMSLTGLTPSIGYDVYVVAGGKINTGASEDWGVRIGFAPNVYSLVTVDIGDDAALTKYNLGLYNNGTSYPFREDQGSANNACMWAVLAGTAAADASGSLTVYVNEIEGITMGSAVGDRTWFDGILVAPSRQVCNPTPADGAVDLAVGNVTLSWVGGTDPNGLVAAGYYVYLGTAADGLSRLNASLVPAAAPVYPLGQVNMNTTYYWQVEQARPNGKGGAYAAGDPNNIMGPVWKFTTLFSNPIITENPTNQVVSAGSTAQFSVAVESLSPTTFKWYKSTDNANSTPGDDVLVGNNQMLSLSNAAIANEGYYYCVVNNESNTQAVSLTARLAITRMVANWTFDQADYVNGQYLDKSGNGHHAEPNGVPTFAAGKIGDGIYIECKDGKAGPTTQSWARAGTWSPSELSGMLTISFWLKWDGPDSVYTEQVFISKRSSANLNDATHWQLTTTSGNSILLQSPNGYLSANGALEKGQWQYIAATFDGKTGVIYINGKLIASGNFALGDAADAMINLGGSNFNNVPGKWLNGILDDVKLYNYALSDLAVAQMYVADNPGSSVCVNSLKPAAAYDLNGDCIVNLGDFAILAGQWLDCGLVPGCVQ